jgi:hypothetical protein
VLRNISWSVRLLRWGLLALWPNPQRGGPPLIGCPRLLYSVSGSCLLHSRQKKLSPRRTARLYQRGCNFVLRCNNNSYVFSEYFVDNKGVSLNPVRVLLEGMQGRGRGRGRIPVMFTVQKWKKAKRYEIKTETTRTAPLNVQPTY